MKTKKNHKKISNNTVQYYDIMYQNWIPDERTQEEVELMQDYLELSSQILDVGVGTGRHLIPLSEKGFSVTGIESSQQMISILKNKIPTAQVLPGDFAEAVSKLESQSYDLVVCMWNAIYEIAIDEVALSYFFKQIFRILNDGGVLILSSSDSDNFEVQDYDFKHSIEKDDKRYDLTWSVLSFDSETLTTTAEELIQVFNLAGDLLDTQRNEITQRHWLQSELMDVAETQGFSGEVRGLNSSKDKYYLFFK